MQLKKQMNKTYITSHNLIKVASLYKKLLMYSQFIIRAYQMLLPSLIEICSKAAKVVVNY